MRVLRCRSLILSSSIVLAFAVAGCHCESSSTSTTSTGSGGSGGSGASGGAGGSGATGGSGECASDGDGSVDVQVNGLPDGVVASVKLTGPDGDRAVEHTETVSGSAAGSYTVTADRVTSADPIVRTAYEPTVSADAFCLDAGGTQTVTVDYAAIPTSHKLWTTNSAGGAGALLAFDGASLTATGDVSAAVRAESGAGKDIAFDAEGNLWTFGGTVADKMVLRFPAASLGTSGMKQPDREIDFPAGGCSPATAGMAFDPDGNLWITSPCTNSVVRLAAEQLDASGEVTPAVTITGLVGPRGIAFDHDGNLWVADTDAELVLRYDAAHLASSIDGAPDRSITAMTDATGGTTLAPSWLAFDASGSLWTNDFGANAAFPIAAADQEGTGAATIVPAVQITIGVTAVLESMAFDESGGLWMAGSQGKIVRLAPTQLGTSSGPGNPTMPETIVSSTDIGSVGNLAFYPAPAALPLFHSLP